MDQPIDEDMLDAQTGGDAGLKRDVLRLFVQQAEALLEGVAPAAEPLAFADILHRIQGSSRAVGARRLSDVAGVCESEIRRDGGMSPGTITLLRNAVADACRFAAVLHEGLAETSSPKQPKADNHLRPSASHPGQRMASKRE